MSQRYADSDKYMRDLEFTESDLGYILLLIREIHASWMKSTPDPRWLRGEEHDRRKLLRLKTSLAPSDSMSRIESIESGTNDWRERDHDDVPYNEEWREEIQKWVGDVQRACSEVSTEDESSPALHFGRDGMGSSCGGGLSCDPSLGASPSGVGV